MIATLEQLKTYLEITDSSSDDLLEMLLQASSDGIESYCMRKFGVAEYAEVLNGNGTSSLFLKNFPVSELEKLEINTGTRTSPVWEEVDPDSYDIYEDLGEITAFGQFSRGIKVYKATYTAGYATIPADLQLACVKLASAYYSARKSDGVVSESVAGDSISFADASSMAGIIPTINLYRSHYV